VKDVDPAMRDRADGSLRSLLARLARLDVRVVPFCGIGDPTLADSNLDRLARNAHRIEMRAKASSQTHFATASGEKNRKRRKRRPRKLA